MIILALGTNLEPRENYLKQALEQLEFSGVKILKQSKIYTTPPWGNVADQQFLNMCIEVIWNKTAYELLDITQKIENNLGRVREVHWGNRTIDIDIIEFDNQVFNDERLVVPHKYLHERNFVLLPICEMFGDIKIDNQSVAKSLEKITDEIEVYKDKLQKKGNICLKLEK